MNDYKEISDNKLRELFNGIALDTPTPDFTINLMEKIEKEAQIARKRKNGLVFLQMTAGALSMILLPALVIYLCKLFIPEFSFSFPKINLHFDTNLIVIGFSILLLLIADTLYRKYTQSENKK
ncbi:MAG: hypothetical protein LBU22_07820 [Dysgonamonadaceae bacterium]|jgi:hypothetical protein|nr:hypothetical protein [Dysgonamonadaceae bacterium]